MNTALQTHQEKTLRDLYMLSDRTRGPEAYVLAYDHAYEIGKAIADNGSNLYLRSKAAAEKAIEILNRGYNSKELPLTKKQYDVLKDAEKKISALPTEEDKFVEECVKKYTGLVPNFNMKNYGL